MKALRVIIIEDEPRAANRIKNLLLESSIHTQVLGVSDSVEDSIILLNEIGDLDLIISDIQLGDGLSFEIFSQFNSLPPIIFTTAYDQYALKAFKNNGIDYLLKPIKQEDLDAALKKLTDLQKPLDLSVLSTLAEQLNVGQQRKDRFLVKVGTHLKSVPVSSIAAVYSFEKGTYIWLNTQRNYLIDYTLDQVEQFLNPQEFMRLNRNFILNIDAEFDVLQWSNSRYKIELPGYNGEMVVVSRSRAKEFKRWLGDS